MKPENGATEEYPASTGAALTPAFVNADPAPAPQSHNSNLNDLASKVISYYCWAPPNDFNETFASVLEEMNRYRKSCFESLTYTREQILLHAIENANELLSSPAYFPGLAKFSKEQKLKNIGTLKTSMPATAQISHDKIAALQV